MAILFGVTLLLGSLLLPSDKRLHGGGGGG